MTNGSFGLEIESVARGSAERRDAVHGRLRGRRQAASGEARAGRKVERDVDGEVLDRLRSSRPFLRATVTKLLALSNAVPVISVFLAASFGCVPIASVQSASTSVVRSLSPLPNSFDSESWATRLQSQSPLLHPVFTWKSTVAGSSDVALKPEPTSVLPSIV